MIKKLFKRYQKVSPPLPESLWQNPWHFIAFGFGTGALPFAPGTFGTLIAIPFYLLFSTLSLPYYLIVLLFSTIAASLLCDRVEKELKVHDHPGMCIDEVIGYLITMTAAPQGFIWVWVGFVLFRLFDIWKPWPIRYIDETVQGGFGVILDDALAGVYSCLALQALAYFLLPS